MLQGVSMGCPAQHIEGLGLIRVWICMDMHGFALDMYGGSFIFIYIYISINKVCSGTEGFELRWIWRGGAEGGGRARARAWVMGAHWYIYIYILTIYPAVGALYVPWWTCILFTVYVQYVWYVRYSQYFTSIWINNAVKRIIRGHSHYAEIVKITQHNQKQYLFSLFALKKGYIFKIHTCWRPPVDATPVS